MSPKTAPKKTEPVVWNDRSRAKKSEDKAKKAQKPTESTAIVPYVPPPPPPEEPKAHKGSYEYQVEKLLAKCGLTEKYEGATSEAKLVEYLRDRIHRETKNKKADRKPLEIEKKVLGWLDVRADKRKLQWDADLGKDVPKGKNYYGPDQKAVRAPLAPRIAPCSHRISLSRARRTWTCSRRLW